MFLSFSPTYRIFLLLRYQSFYSFSFSCPSRPMIPAAAKLPMAIAWDTAFTGVAQSPTAKTPLTSVS
jgi:hypothetical protein